MPVDRAAVLRLALPELRATLPRVVAPSLNVTVPVGMPPPATVAVTVAVKVTDWLDTEGLTEELTTVTVAFFTV